ncbi:IS3 family transposase [Microbispora sp. H10670]|uniref:IS3 family transposase n=1 Tax=Microbispora sp. H10670 TaxID=2729108 RepID=UPI001603D08D|nr:IS3 family transposase [Microbispora sp. H10670]
MPAESTPNLGEKVNRKRVERLMRAAGLQSVYRRKRRRNLVNRAIEEDLAQRCFVQAPDALIDGANRMAPGKNCPDYIQPQGLPVT